MRFFFFFFFRFFSPESISGYFAADKSEGISATRARARASISISAAGWNSDDEESFSSIALLYYTLLYSTLLSSGSILFVSRLRLKKAWEGVISFWTGGVVIVIDIDTDAFLSFFFLFLADFALFLFATTFLPSTGTGTNWVSSWSFFSSSFSSS